ncbi:MAG: hypothetical protein L0I92_08565, partial [Staphylococcus equorum]|nr:hypothetical protein [Staphylococcus equorum]
AFSFFFFLYVYIKGKEYKYRHIIYVLLTLFILISSTKAIGLIGSSTNKLTDYTGYTESAISVSNGIGASLYNLPEGLKQLAIVSVSQIQPFPFWNGVYKAETLLEQFSMLAFGIAAIFWFYVIFVSVLSFIKNYKSLPKTLLLGLIFFCVFLLGNTFNMNTRRIMAVYPIVYTFFVYSQAHYNTMLTKRKTIKFFAIIYIALAIIYILLKYR